MLLPFLPRRAAVPGIGGILWLALLLPAPAAATTLLCSAEGQDGITARIDDPWGDAPVLQGKSGPLPVTKFVRGKTVIFDARREILYFETGTHAFAYAQMEKGIVTLRGTCEEGS